MTLAQSSNEGVAAVARSLDVDVTTLRTWLHRTQQPSSESETLTPSERKELAQLRREVLVLKMERKILEKIKVSGLGVAVTGTPHHGTSEGHLRLQS